jgi:hypothetical protein
MSHLFSSLLSRPEKFQRLYISVPWISQINFKKKYWLNISKQRKDEVKKQILISLCFTEQKLHCETFTRQIYVAE